MTDAAIEVKGLVKTYPKGVRALDGVSFDVAAGSVFGLLGKPWMRIMLITARRASHRPTAFTCRRRAQSRLPHCACRRR
jgi:hypothetical protein